MSSDDNRHVGPEGLWIDADSPVPLHQQIRQRLEALLLAGSWPPPHPIPSSRYLAASLGVSRGTVITACQELVAAGFLTSRPRSGLVSTVGDRTPTPNRSQQSPQRMSWDDFIIKSPGQPESPAPTVNYLDYTYPFLSGQIEDRGFPAKAWLQALDHALDGPHRSASLRDAGEEDDELLVEALITQILPARGITARPDEVLITSGTQQALSCAMQSLLDSGRVAAMEEPGYIDARAIIQSTGARIVPLPIDREGARVPANLDCDVVYLTPSHQNPTNITMSAARRRHILQAAQNMGAVVVEDDYDSEMRFRGAPVPSLKSQDTEGRVVYISGFAKSLAPGLRLGFAVAPPPLIAQMRQWRSLSTKHPVGHVQRAAALFVNSGSYHRSLRLHRSRLEQKWQAVGDALEKSIPDLAGERPTGGLAYWLTGPERLDATELADRLRQRSVLIVSGQPYFWTSQPRHHFRVGFNAISLENIQPGIRIIGEEIARMSASPSGQ